MARWFILLHLRRYEYGDKGTRGQLVFPDGSWLHTLELPWRNNKQNVSCIPEGRYTLVRNRYNKGGYMSVEVTNVPNRDEIQFHIGNTIRDIRGCIVVGLSTGRLDGLPAVMNSTRAFENHFWPKVKNRLPMDILIGTASSVPTIDPTA